MTKRKKHRRTTTKVSGYGWGPLGWTAQQYLNPGQFGETTTDTGSMTTTGGDSGGTASG